MVSASNSRNITTKLDFHNPTQGIFIATYLGSCKKLYYSMHRQSILTM